MLFWRNLLLLPSGHKMEATGSARTTTTIRTSNLSYSISWRTWKWGVNYFSCLPDPTIVNSHTILSYCESKPDYKKIHRTLFQNLTELSVREVCSSVEQSALSLSHWALASCSCTCGVAVSRRKYHYQIYDLKVGTHASGRAHTHTHTPQHGKDNGPRNVNIKHLNFYA